MDRLILQPFECNKPTGLQKHLEWNSSFTRSCVTFRLKTTKRLMPLSLKVFGFPASSGPRATPSKSASIFLKCSWKGEFSFWSRSNHCNPSHLFIVSDPAFGASRILSFIFQSSHRRQMTLPVFRYRNWGTACFFDLYLIHLYAKWLYSERSM